MIRISETFTFTNGGWEEQSGEVYVEYYPDPNKNPTLDHDYRFRAALKEGGLESRYKGRTVREACDQLLTAHSLKDISDDNTIEENVRVTLRSMFAGRAYPAEKLEPVVRRMQQAMELLSAQVPVIPYKPERDFNLIDRSAKARLEI